MCATMLPALHVLPMLSLYYLPLLAASSELLLHSSITFLRIYTNWESYACMLWYKVLLIATLLWVGVNPIRMMYCVYDNNGFHILSLSVVFITYVCICNHTALLLSALKSNGVPYNPAFIKKIIENTAVPLGHHDPFSIGHGIIQVCYLCNWPCCYYDEWIGATAM